MASPKKNKPLSLAIAGNPNSGKTTLFNRLTGLRQKVGNYPGITVEKKTGIFIKNNTEIQLIDLPGTYGLSPRSEDERIASEIIQGIRPDVPPVQGVLCVVDSTTLERSLYLSLQIIESGIPVVLLLNMTDELHKRGTVIDTLFLAKKLKVPVISISATKGTGIQELESLLEAWEKNPPFIGEIKSFSHPSIEDIAQKREVAKKVTEEAYHKEIQDHPWTDKVDHVVMHKLWGPLIFVGVVLVVFQAIFSWAQPFMDAIDWVFVWMAQTATHLLPDGLLSRFLTDAVLTGVGSVLIFLPQILIVFFFIAILDHSGYMARGAMVMDRLFRKVGLQGRSFLPLMSSYACAIPGIMSARTIENNRDRLATILVAPFMTCSARLPVYALLIGAFVPDKSLIKGVFGLQAAVLLSLYLIGFFAAMITAFFLKSSILKYDQAPFILDIPPYRLPTIKTILLLMWDRSKIFIRRASTLILGTTVVLWCLVSFPSPTEPQSIEKSYAGKIGKAIEPIIKPLGFNWKIGVGLLGAQAAREVMVSSLATIYKVKEDVEENTTSLQDAIKEDLTPLAAVSLMVFFVFAMQCMSTIAITKRETAGWKIPIIMFVYMNAYAYVASLLVYQGGKLLGFT
ncbi:ferrous iron transport protein B [bacterium F11]|nr:ferrous iron transport protein B [bacterium F11]